MKSQILKFVVAVTFAVVVMSSAKAEDILKSLSSEALVELETLQTQIRITHQAWEKAIEKQKQTKIEETQAKADDDGAAAVLKGAEEHYHYVVEAPQTPYDQAPSSSALKESLLQRAVREFNEAGGTVEKLNDIRADQEEDLLETGKLCDARKNLKKVRKQVGVIRAHIMAEYAAEFAEPGPESTDKRMNRILSERLNAAKAEKARTAKIVARKKKAREGADADVAKTTETLEKLKRERNEIRATEELRNGFKEMRGEFKAVKTAIEKGDEKIVIALQENKQILQGLDGKLVSLLDLEKKNAEELAKKLDTQHGIMMAAIAAKPLLEEDAVTLSAIMKVMLEKFEEQKTQGIAQDEALANLQKEMNGVKSMVTTLSAKAEKKTTTEMYVQWQDPRCGIWYQVNAVTREVLKPKA